MKGLFGSYEVEILEDALREKSPGAETKFNWSRMERLVTSDSHAYAYATAVSAVIIPRHKIMEGNYDEFVEALKQKMDRTQRPDSSGSLAT